MNFNKQNLFAILLVCVIHESTFAYNQGDLQRALNGDKNLVGADLQGAELEDIDLSGVDLTDANLKKAHLTDINFNGARFIRTNLRKVHIDGGYFEDVVFDHADLIKSALSFVCLRRAQIRNNTTFTHARFEQVSFWNSILSNVDFSDSVSERGCNFMRSQLDHIMMRRCILNGFSIGESSLTNIDLQGTKLISGTVRMSMGDGMDGRVWANVDMRGASVVDSWFFGDLILFKDGNQARHPMLKSLEMPWYYKLSLVLNPLHAAKRMMCDYDEYNVNSALIDSHFEEAFFCGVGFTNIALKNCTGIDSLETRSGCLFANVPVEDDGNVTQIISDE